MAVAGAAVAVRRWHAMVEGTGSTLFLREIMPTHADRVQCSLLCTNNAYSHGQTRCITEAETIKSCALGSGTAAASVRCPMTNGNALQHAWAKQQP